MFENLSLMQVLMQATTPTGPGGPAGGSTMSSFIGSPMFLMLLMFGVFYAVIIRGNRREKRKKADMLSAVGRNDRVLTIGGIVGTVVQERGDELVIKVDETTNTKINVIRSAIRQVLTPDEKPGDLSK